MDSKTYHARPRPRSLTELARAAIIVGCTMFASVFANSAAAQSFDGEGSWLTGADDPYAVPDGSGSFEWYDHLVFESPSGLPGTSIEVPWPDPFLKTVLEELNRVFPDPFHPDPFYTDPFPDSSYPDSSYPDSSYPDSSYPDSSYPDPFYPDRF